MRLLFDHNLSPKLVELLADIFPFSEHVYRIELDQASDLAICKYAMEHDFCVVTKDADYETLAFRADTPSIICIKRGNCSVDQVERIIREHSEQIVAFAEHENAQLLILL